MSWFDRTAGERRVPGVDPGMTAKEMDNPELVDHRGRDQVSAHTEPILWKLGKMFELKDDAVITANRKVSRIMGRGNGHLNRFRTSAKIWYGKKTLRRRNQASHQTYIIYPAPLIGPFHLERGNYRFRQRGLGSCWTSKVKLDRRSRKPHLQSSSIQILWASEWCLPQKHNGCSI